MVLNITARLASWLFKHQQLGFEACRWQREIGQHCLLASGRACPSWSYVGWVHTGCVQSLLPLVLQSCLPAWLHMLFMLLPPVLRGQHVLNGAYDAHAILNLSMAATVHC